LEIEKQGKQSPLGALTAQTCSSFLLYRVEPQLADAEIEAVLRNACAETHFVTLTLCAILAKEKKLLDICDQLTASTSCKGSQIAVSVSKADADRPNFIRTVSDNAHILSIIHNAIAESQDTIPADFSFLQHCQLKPRDQALKPSQTMIQEPLAKIVRFTMSPSGQRLGLLDADKLLLATHGLSNPVALEGVNSGLWDLEFLGKVKVNVTDAMITAVDTGVLSVNEILLLPRGIFGDVDQLFAALQEGFLLPMDKDGEQHLDENLIDLLATYTDDEMTEAELAHLRNKTPEKEGITKLKLLFKPVQTDTCGWRSLHVLGIGFLACLHMKLANMQLLLEEEIGQMLLIKPGTKWEDIAEMPEALAVSFVEGKKNLRTSIRPPNCIMQTLKSSRCCSPSGFHLQIQDRGRRTL
jgi:hypothetical protein